MRLKLEIACVFQVHKSFFRLMAVIRKKRYHRQIKIAVSIKISRHGLVTSVDGEKIFLGEMICAIIHKNVNTVIGFEYSRIVRVVATGIYNIRIAVMVKICELKIG